jgi:hypothetical protein
MIGILEDDDEHEDGSSNSELRFNPDEYRRR